VTVLVVNDFLIADICLWCVGENRIYCDCNVFNIVSCKDVDRSGTG